MIIKSASKSNPHSELDNISLTIDLADVLSDCNIIQTDLLDFEQNDDINNTMPLLPSEY